MKIDIKKEVYEKSKYKEIIDTSFNEFGNKNSIEETPPTIEEFFNDYNELFFLIPKEGDINSHRQLVNRSLEYIGLESNPLIDELRTEISVLKQEILNYNTTIGTLTNQISSLSTQFKLP